MYTSPSGADMHVRLALKLFALSLISAQAHSALHPPSFVKIRHLPDLLRDTAAHVGAHHKYPFQNASGTNDVDATARLLHRGTVTTLAVT